VTAATGSGDGRLGLSLVRPAGIVDVLNQSATGPFVGPSYTVSVRRIT